MFLRRVRGGELGSLPVIIGLIVFLTIFQSQHAPFLLALTITNLTLQVAATGTIAVGIVLVLLLGEVDLSVGSVSGVTAAALAVLVVKHGYAGWEAIVIALIMG